MKYHLAAAVLVMGLPACIADTRPLPPPPEPPPPVYVYAPTSDGVAQFIQDVSKVSPPEAKRIGKLVVKVCAKHRVDPLLLAAIVMHESAFKPGTLVCTGRGGCDYGLGQINEVHIDDLGLDPERLVFDDAYNLEVAARLLARARRFADTDPKWWSRYHDRRDKPRLAWEMKVEPLIKIAYKTEQKKAA